MTRRIVILANSFKGGERCIAGIDINSGEWVRPVSPPAGGAVGRNRRNIDGREPLLGEVVEISFIGPGPDRGCQPENRLLNQVPWQHVRHMPVEEILTYCEANDIILHNHDDCVEAGYFETIPLLQWQSLQLIHSENVHFYSTIWDGKRRWRSRLQYGGARTLDIKLTDPVLVERLSRGEQISHNCILTISLAGPWSPDGIQPMRCYKLVAGVIEL